MKAEIADRKAAHTGYWPAPKATAVALSAFGAACLLFGIAGVGRAPRIRGSGSAAVRPPAASNRRLAEQRRETLAAAVAARRTAKIASYDGKNGEEDPLIDLAVVGFEKCGTSFLMNSLFSIDEIYMGGDTEHCLSREGLKEKVVDLYSEHSGEVTSEGVPVKKGLKCPRDLQDKYGISNYEKYLPKIKFVVSMRHPILWFQSFYNYRLSQIEKKTGEIWHPPTKDLIGPCVEGSPYMKGFDGKEKNDKKSVCTDGARFHHYLSRLGKTPMDTDEERALLKHEMSVHSLPDARVFLMEIGQFSIDNATLASAFEEDIGTYLGLEGRVNHLKKHRSRAKRPVAEATKDIALNICDEEHDLVRSILVEEGRDAYVWIRDYFLHSPDVVVSSRDHFLELIEMWQYDPCDSEDERVRSLLL